MDKIINTRWANSEQWRSSYAHHNVTDIEEDQGILVPSSDFTIYGEVPYIITFLQDTGALVKGFTVCIRAKDKLRKSENQGPYKSNRVVMIITTILGLPSP